MIPSRLIFIWFGSHFPWENVTAIRSAIRVNQPQEVYLLHQGLSEDLPELREFLQLPCFKFIEADQSWFQGLPDHGVTWELFQELKSPASRANLLRLAVLWKVGGVYLDTDTISIRDLQPLREKHQGFIGVEPVALPREYFESNNPWRHIPTGLKFAWRELCARVPGGVSLFRPIEPFFHSSVNNAVIGSIPEHPIIKKAFETIYHMDPEKQRKRFRLGTHLMQDVTANKSQEDFKVFPAEYFYPLGPEISAQWFRHGTNSQVDKFTTNQTYVVHWYNSVEARFLKEKLSQNWVDNHPHTAFSQLVRDYAMPLSSSHP
jgi:hypothetical protein